MPRQFGGVEIIGSQSCSLGIEASTKDSVVFRSRGEVDVCLSCPKEGMMLRKNSLLSSRVWDLERWVYYEMLFAKCCIRDVVCLSLKNGRDEAFMCNNESFSTSSAKHFFRASRPG